MNVMTSEFKQRVEHWIRTLKNDLYRPLGEISLEGHRTFEELSFEESQKLEYIPVKPGFTWGRTWEYCWFRGKIVLPKEAEGKRIVVDLQAGGESTLFVNGKSFGTYRAPWVRYPHQYIEDNCLTSYGHEGEIFELVMETYAGHYYPEIIENGCSTGPILEDGIGLSINKEEGRRVVLGTPTYGIWDEDAYQLFMDAETLYKLLNILSPTSLRAAKVAQALEKFTLIVDFEQDKDDRDASYREARSALTTVLRSVNGTETPIFYAVGNAHIDLAWLWPMEETYRKTCRTFAAQLRLLEEYPDYYYIQSQPAAYEMCRKYYPELFERIRLAIKKGNWIAEGAMWVEPDTNMPSGEALVRQVLYGKQYFKNILGVDSQILWLPDTFGYTGALPQILKSCGVRYLVTQKIFWSYNDGEQFPYHYFNWEGIDGTKIQAFLPTSYTYETDPSTIATVWNNRSQIRNLDTFLLPFGYGDGGGGPARDHIEFLNREKDLQGMPKVKMANPVEMFDKLNADGGPTDTYKGELYFTAHRGTYTTQAVIKRNNRKAELALREMEFWGSLAMVSRQNADAYDIREANDLWKELLLHQFHDILPGSGIRRIYEEAERRVDAVISRANEKTMAYEAQLTIDEQDKLDAQGSSKRRCEQKLSNELSANGSIDAITVFNSLSFPHEGIVTLPSIFAEGAVTSDGNIVQIEKIDNEVKGLIRVPPVGAITIYPTGKQTMDVAEHACAVTGTSIPYTCGSNESTMYAHAYAEGENFVLENNKIVVRVNLAGEITSYICKESGREFITEPGNRFHLYKDVPRNFDAWDIDSNYVDQEIQGVDQVQLQVVSSGLEAIVKVTGIISGSCYTQYIRLTADSDRLEFDTTVDWKELHRLLKVSFSSDINCDNGINEMQFGYVERPTGRSRQYEKDRFEVCNHHYSALADGSHGIAVLNESKYGISMLDGTMALTLLRAASSPEMRTDNRVHHFIYAFTAFEGDFAQSNVVQQGYELNVPLQIIPGRVKDFSMVQIDHPNIILDTMKPAEDGSGDLILRFYESKRAAVRTTVRTAFRGQAWKCDMMESKEEKLNFDKGKLMLDFRAFEIKTIRITKAKLSFA